MDLNFDSERALLQAKRAELLAGVATIDEALAALDGVGLHGGRAAKAGGPAAVRAGRRPMSDDAREAARKRMLKYWAGKRRAAKSR